MCSIEIVPLSVCPKWNGMETQFFMVLNTGFPVLRKFRFKNLQKVPFGEVQAQDPFPALSDTYSFAYILIFSSLGPEMTQK
jgi:hypothetical protein